MNSKEAGRRPPGYSIYLSEKKERRPEASWLLYCIWKSNEGGRRPPGF